MCVEHKINIELHTAQLMLLMWLMMTVVENYTLYQNIVVLKCNILQI